MVGVGFAGVAWPRWSGQGPGRSHVPQYSSPPVFNPHVLQSRGPSFIESPGLMDSDSLVLQSSGPLVLWSSMQSFVYPVLRSQYCLNRKHGSIIVAASSETCLRFAKNRAGRPGEKNISFVVVVDFLSIIMFSQILMSY